MLRRGFKGMQRRRRWSGLARKRKIMNHGKDGLLSIRLRRPDKMRKRYLKWRIRWRRDLGSGLPWRGLKASCLADLGWAANQVYQDMPHRWYRWLKGTPLRSGPSFGVGWSSLNGVQVDA